MSRAGGASPPSIIERLRPLLAVVPVDHVAKKRLCGLMGGADRHYHGADHLLLLWSRHRRYAAQANLDRPEINRLVGCAIAYHDAVYEAGRSDNESRSAQLWLRASHGRMAEDDRRWVAKTIEATRDHLGYASHVAVAGEDLPIAERARLWMLDLDLTPIGETPAVFAANSAQLRAESALLPEAVFESARIAMLRRLGALPRLYRSPILAAVFEVRARRNLARELAAAASKPAAVHVVAAPGCRASP